MIHFLFMFNRQRRIRFERWFKLPEKIEKKCLIENLMTLILCRSPRMCSFIEYTNLKIVYRRYASLFFCCGIDQNDNELIHLEIMHRFVEILDQYFGTVCELDVVFNFEKTNFILNEFLLGGELQEPGKLEVLRAVRTQDRLQERETKKLLFQNNRVA